MEDPFDTGYASETWTTKLCHDMDGPQDWPHPIGRYQVPMPTLEPDPEAHTPLDYHNSDDEEKVYVVPSNFMRRWFTDQETHQTTSHELMGRTEYERTFTVRPNQWHMSISVTSVSAPSMVALDGDWLPKALSCGKWVKSVVFIHAESARAPVVRMQGCVVVSERLYLRGSIVRDAIASLRLANVCVNAEDDDANAYVSGRILNMDEFTEVIRTAEKSGAVRVAAWVSFILVDGPVVQKTTDLKVLCHRIEHATKRS